jgi:hypothetical protein
MKFCCALLLTLTLCSLLALQAAGQNASDPAARFECKLQRVQSNAAQAQPEPSPTEFTEQEINAYFASGKVQLPTGVRSVVFQEQPGIIVGTARVDFDQLKSGKNSYNPLLSVFSGVHEVVVTAHAYGAKGEGLVHVDSVSLDGVEVPAFVLKCSSKIPQAGVSGHRHRLALCAACACGRGKCRPHRVTVIQQVSYTGLPGISRVMPGFLP